MRSYIAAPSLWRIGSSPSSVGIIGLTSGAPARIPERGQNSSACDAVAIGRARGTTEVRREQSSSYHLDPHSDRNHPGTFQESAVLGIHDWRSVQFRRLLQLRARKT